MAETLTLMYKPFNQVNKSFSHKSIHKFTCHQAYRNLKSIIDYVVERQESQLVINDVRVYRVLECDLEHFIAEDKRI